MTDKPKVLYIGRKPEDTNARYPDPVHQRQSVLDGGGEFVEFSGANMEDFISDIQEADSLICQGHLMPEELFTHMGANGRCKGAVLFGHGFDKLNLNSANQNGVILANTASFGTEEVSNHAMMLFLVCARKFVLHNKLVKSGTWTREYLPHMGHIEGETFGIIGLGDIGRAVARKAQAFRCKVIAYDPFISSWDAKEYGVEMMGTLDDLARRSDYVSVHTFLTPATKGLIGENFISHMKSSAYLINCSRGPVVDEKALINALRQKRIAGAGLDVFEQEPVSPDNPLLNMDNVAVTNHYASYSEKAWERANKQLGEEAVRIATGYWPMSLINPGVQTKLPSRKRAIAWEIMVSQAQQ